MENDRKDVSLALWIIKKTDTDAYRAGKLTGQKHPDITPEDKRKIGGRASFLLQAKYLENRTEAGKNGKLSFHWINVNTDVDQINYDVDILPELCELAQIEDPRVHQLNRICAVKMWREKVADCVWVCRYYDDILKGLLIGRKIKEAEDETWLMCLNAVAMQNEPVWERVFSRRTFHDSKKFQKEYRTKVITVLRKYSPYCTANMTELAEIAEKQKEDEYKKILDAELLDMHNIHSYAQTLEWKGPLAYGLKDSKGNIITIDTKNQIYGTVLNTQTLQHAWPVSLSGCHRIMTIENKANYESMPFRDDTLYIFCHGFLTPKEVLFLRQLVKCAPAECTYLHWGDMDFGGISIFQYIREKVFPEIQPYRMDVEDFLQAVEQGAGIPLEAVAREKLLHKDAGVLEGLKQKILETNLTIEQEYLL